MAISCCPIIQADEGTANVNLEVNIVSPPSVITWKAIGVGTRKATLYGILASMGSASSVTVSFGWDIVSHADDPTAYSQWTSPQVMTHSRAFMTRIDNLMPFTKYYYRAKAEYDGITSYGYEHSFTTHPGGFWWWYYLVYF